MPFKEKLGPRSVEEGEATEQEKSHYLSLLGKCIYLLFTYPELGWIISFLAKFSRNPSKVAITTLRSRVIGYLKRTVNEHCVRYTHAACFDANTTSGDDPALTKDGKLKECDLSVFNLHSYADATYQSPGWLKGYEYGGHCVIMCGAAVTAKSGKQTIIGHSTMDTEWYQLVEAYKATQFFVTLCDEAGYKRTEPIDFFEDNKPTAQSVTSSVMKKKSWHINKRYLAVRVYVQDTKEMSIFWIAGKCQVADLLTKGVSQAVWCDLVPVLLGLTPVNARMHSIEMQINTVHPHYPP